MSKEISAYDLGEYRINQMIKDAVSKRFSEEELDDLQDRCMRKQRMKMKRRKEHNARSTD